MKVSRLIADPMRKCVWSLLVAVASSLGGSNAFAADGTGTISVAGKGKATIDKTASNVPADHAGRRHQLVESLTKRGIYDKRTLDALSSVERHLFVPKYHQHAAYKFGNLPIGAGQVIGDPYIVAYMTQALHVKPTDVVLEIGTGCGYQAAVLSKLVRKLYSIEIEPDLAKTAKTRLTKLGYKNIETKTGDGYLGWPEHAPFDAIIVTSFPDQIPKRLVEQLKPGGFMVLPVFGKVQRMKRISKRADGTVAEEVLNPVGIVF